MCGDDSCICHSDGETLLVLIVRKQLSHVLERQRLMLETMRRFLETLGCLHGLPSQGEREPMIFRRISPTVSNSPLDAHVTRHVVFHNFKPDSGDIGVRCKA